MKTKNNVLLIFGSLFCLFLFLGACTEEQGSASTDILQQQSPSQTQNEKTEEQVWPPNVDTKGPWDGLLYMAASSDGLTFEDGSFVLEHASVPNLLITSSGTLILTYQFFSYKDKGMFDVIAYSLSDDNGKTWSDPQAVIFENLPSPIDTGKFPMDPTLVETEDGALRLYFTYHAYGAEYPALYVSTAADGKITSPFVVEETPALALDAFLLDPAVVFFNGKWHHYTWQMESDDNYHSVSDDGLSFTLEENINLPMSFLGQVIPVDDGLRFYGTDKGDILSAFSSDGYSWKMDDGNRIQGVDPGVAQLSDGMYVMVYTSMNFN